MRFWNVAKDELLNVATVQQARHVSWDSRQNSRIMLPCGKSEIELFSGQRNGKRKRSEIDAFVSELSRHRSQARDLHLDTSAQSPYRRGAGKGDEL